MSLSILPTIEEHAHAALHCTDNADMGCASFLVFLLCVYLIYFFFLFSNMWD